MPSAAALLPLLLGLAPLLGAGGAAPDDDVPDLWRPRRLALTADRERDLDAERQAGVLDMLRTRRGAALLAPGGEAEDWSPAHPLAGRDLVIVAGGEREAREAGCELLLALDELEAEAIVPSDRDARREVRAGLRYQGARAELEATLYALGEERVLLARFTPRHEVTRPPRPFGPRDAGAGEDGAPGEAGAADPEALLQALVARTVRDAQDFAYGRRLWLRRDELATTPLDLEDARQAALAERVLGASAMGLCPRDSLATSIAESLQRLADAHPLLEDGGTCRWCGEVSPARLRLSDPCDASLAVRLLTDALHRMGVTFPEDLEQAPAHGADSFEQILFKELLGRRERYRAVLGNRLAFDAKPRSQWLWEPGLTYRCRLVLVTEEALPLDVGLTDDVMHFATEGTVVLRPEDPRRRAYGLKKARDPVLYLMTKEEGDDPESWEVVERLPGKRITPEAYADLVERGMWREYAGVERPE